MRIGTLWSALALAAISSIGTALASEQDSLQDGYGIFESSNAEGGWVVIGDQAMQVDEQLTVRDELGSSVGEIAGIAPGTAVRYGYRIENQVWYVSMIKLIEEIPYIVDEDGVPDR